MHLRLEAHVLAFQIQVLQRVAQREQDAVGVERLFQKIVRAELRRLHGRLNGAVTGDHDYLRVGIELAQLPQRFEPIHPLHLHIQKDEVRPELGIQLQRLPAGRTRPHFDGFVLEQLLQRFADALLVVDHEDAPAHDLLRFTR